MRVNVGHLRQLRQEATEARKRYSSALKRAGWFCDECGETNPENGFCAVYIHSPESINNSLCQKCAAVPRPGQERAAACGKCRRREGVYECTNQEECGKRFCTICADWYYDVAECPECNASCIYNPDRGAR